MTARVERVELRQVALPLRSPFVSAAHHLTERRVVLVRVEAAGTAGWGEAPPVPGYSSETIEDVWRALSGTASLVGATPAAGMPEALPATARSAVEGAMADLRARMAGMPLWQFRGGSSPDAPAGAVAGLAASPADLVAAVDALVDSGYRAVKVKIGPHTGFDALAAVRSAHPGLEMGADGNGSFGAGATSELSHLDPLGLAYLEQPLPASDLSGHSELRMELTTPICLDESITSSGDLDAALAAAAADVVNLKPGRVGGGDQVSAMAARCRAAGVRLRIGGMLETGIGRAHLVALATLPGFTVTGDLAGSDRYFERDIVDMPWRVHEGALIAPDGPGIGVGIDEEWLEHVTERVMTLG